MKETEFEAQRENCPWYYVATNWEHSKRCLAADRGPKYNVTANDWGKDCCEKNCAVVYWVKILAKEIRS